MRMLFGCQEIICIRNDLLQYVYVNENSIPIDCIVFNKAWIVDMNYKCNQVKTIKQAAKCRGVLTLY